MTDQMTDQTSGPGNSLDENGVSTSERIKAIEAEIKDLTQEKEDHERQARELMEAERRSPGKFHAQEIFQHKRDKLRLEVEIDWRQKRLKRLRLGMEEFM